MIPKVITRRWLTSRRACIDQRRLFSVTFPDGMPVTLPNLRKAAKAGLAIDWLEGHLSDPARATYNAATASAWATNNAARASTWATYDAAVNSARATYDAAVNSARATYDAAVNSALMRAIRKDWRASK